MDKCRNFIVHNAAPCVQARLHFMWGLPWVSTTCSVLAYNNLWHVKRSPVKCAFSKFLAVHSTLDFTRSPLAGKGTWCLLPTNTSMLSTATKHFDRAANVCITVFIYKSSLHKMLEITNFVVKIVKAKFLYFHEFKSAEIRGPFC